MAFIKKAIQKVDRVVRGESEVEQSRRRVTEAEIRQAQREAMFEARRTEALKFAATRERLKREAKEARLRQRLAPPPRRPMSRGGSLGSPIGGASFDFLAGQVRGGQRSAAIRRPRRRTIRRTSTRVRRVRRPRIATQSRPRSFDVLGF